MIVKAILFACISVLAGAGWAMSWDELEAEQQAVLSQYESSWGDLDEARQERLALGANRWEIVSRVLFPAAKNGLLAAVLLGVGRAIGETMAVLMCTGHAVQIPNSLLDPVRTLTATIAAELGETVAIPMPNPL